MSTTMTSTLLMPEAATGASSIMLPAASADTNNRMVRFDNECVLIPDRSKRPKVLAKSYSLPLWKKKPNHAPDSEAAEAAPSFLGISTSAEDTHVVIKVPIPSFIAKSSRSPNRGRSILSSSPTLKPLSPCLVHRSPSLSPTLPYQPMRRTSLPISNHHRRKDDTALTVPLRACCPDCVPITEESLREGDQWKEKFSRGARRRRSSSLDTNDMAFCASPTTSRQQLKGFTAVTHQLGAEPAVVISCASPRYNKSSNFSITVDEVDKRRKSQEFTEGDFERFRMQQDIPFSSHANPALHSPYTPTSSASHTLIFDLQEKHQSLSSPSSTASTTSELTVPDFSQRRLKSSPIQEEDEDQLFPLPSPRRSPNGSPSTSPSSSLKNSPAASPNTSTSCLSPSPGTSASEHNVISGLSGSGEELLGRSLSRKLPRPDNGLLAPQKPASTLSPSPLSQSIDTNNVDTSFTAPDSTITSASIASTGTPTKPTLSPLLISTHMRVSSSPPPSSYPTGAQVMLVKADHSLATPHDMTKVLPSPPSSPSRQIFSSLASTPFPSSPPSSFHKPPVSPQAAGKRPRRPSFSLPSIKEALRGAGADMLKGVGSLSGGGPVGSP